MNKTLVIATVTLVSAFAFALIVRLAGHLSLNAPDVFSAIGGMVACSVVLMAFSDYRRKPRFAIRGTRQATPQLATPATSSEVDLAAAWTYNTRSA